ncbi:MAG: hypothetical protein E7384_05920 [Ruminococcaceae bacterium]|nr:hypothetical protein [Oscillospiraceae bacterium]
MYDIIKIGIFGIILAVLAVVMRQIKPEFAVLISLAGVSIIFLSVISSVNDLFAGMKSLLANYSDGNIYVSTILKVSGISFVCSFAAETCRDGGCAAVATTVETTGRICVVSAVMPLALTLTETVIEIINTNVF